MTDAGARIATLDDLDAVTAIFSGAFAADPLWSWAIPDLERRARLWRVFVRSALRYPDTWIADGGVAAAMWIPPGGVELTEEDEQQLPALLDELCGERAGDVAELMERFESSHPTGEPHYYLSLLGTHPDHRGRGVGMALPRRLPRSLRRGRRPDVPRVQQPGQHTALRAPRLPPDRLVHDARRPPHGRPDVARRRLESCGNAVGGALQGGDVDLAHREHRLHRAPGPLRVDVRGEELIHAGGHDLPRDAVAVLEPAARAPRRRRRRASPSSGRSRPDRRS